MAIEEEREAHATWAGVAGRWYRMATDRHPATGRLNHLLGILERPSLRKLFLYTKSLTCVIPFTNARDSLATLCAPIVKDQDYQAVQHRNLSAEARIVTLFALVFSTPDQHTTSNIAKDTLTRVSSRPASKIRDIGVELFVTGVEFLLELGATSNRLWQQFSNAINEAIRSSRPSVPSAAGSSDPALLSLDQSLETTAFRTSISNFFYDTLRSLRHRKDDNWLRDRLLSVHAALVWIHGISNILTASVQNSASSLHLGHSSTFFLLSLLSGAVTAQESDIQTVEGKGSGGSAPEQLKDFGPNRYIVQDWLLYCLDLVGPAVLASLLPIGLGYLLWKTNQKSSRKDLSAFPFVLTLAITAVWWQLELKFPGKQSRQCEMIKLVTAGLSLVSYANYVSSCYVLMENKERFLTSTLLGGGGILVTLTTLYTAFAKGWQLTVEGFLSAGLLKLIGWTWYCYVRQRRRETPPDPEHHRAPPSTPNNGYELTRMTTPGRAYDPRQPSAARNRYMPQGLTH